MGVPKFYRWLSERYPLINPKIEDSAAEMPEFGASPNPLASLPWLCRHGRMREGTLPDAALPPPEMPSNGAVGRAASCGEHRARTTGYKHVAWPRPADRFPPLCVLRAGLRYFSAHAPRLDAGTCKVQQRHADPCLLSLPRAHSRDVLTGWPCSQTAFAHS